MRPNDPPPGPAGQPDRSAEATRTQPPAPPGPPPEPDGYTYTPPPGFEHVPPRDPAAAGFAVPGYELGERIGQGGMGVVYAARELELDREVAIKFLGPGGEGSGTAVRRFETEARITAALAHPNIPPVYAHGRLADGRPYLVMKRIRGGTLHDLLQERADPAADLPRLLQIFEQVCQAVGFAHRHGVIHRDLKPRNVMVGSFGEVQVMDWGLAKRTARPDSKTDPEAGGVTITGQGMGTPAYMPPEQAKGEWEQVDARADVFALGAILCTVLTGEPPYAWASTSHRPNPGGTAADLAAAATRLKGCGRDPGLIELALDCLSPNPAGRPATAAVVAARVEEFRKRVADRLRSAEVEKAVAAAEAKAELARARAEAEAEVAAVRERAREARLRRRRRLRLAAAAAVVMTLVAAGGAVWWQVSQTADARAAAAAGRDAYRAGDRAAALKHFGTALTEYEGVVEGPLLWNRATLQLELAGVFTWLGRLEEEARNPAAAAAALERAAERVNHLREAAGRPEYDLALAEVHHQWGIHHGNRSDWQKAEKSYRTEIHLRENVPPGRKADPAYRRDLALGNGYLGDALAEAGKFAAAEEAYREALKIRKELAERSPADPDPQCLHARDFANLGHLFAATGDVDRAVAKHRTRLKCYADHLPPFPALLPGGYRLERANTRCDIAELELDRPAPAADVADLLAAALEEYAALSDGPDVRSAVARAKVCRARLAHSAGDAAGRAEAAGKAVDLLNELVDAGQAQRGDYYHLAVAHALLGAGPDGERHRVLALDRLEAAVRKKFTDRRRLDRDRCLAAVLGEDPKLRGWFAEVRAKLPAPR
ncbi:MAG: hypothetical protein C0501_13455 [Isosphaera sp.]|nr:hypothetical protein [Isosphaera sp.]